MQQNTQIKIPFLDLLLVVFAFSIPFYQDFILEFELINLKYVIFKLGVSTIVFKILEISLDVFTNFGVEYNKANYGVQDSKLKKGDHYSFLGLVIALILLVSIRVWVLGPLASDEWLLINNSFCSVPFLELRKKSVLSTKLLIIYLTMFILVKVKSFFAQVLDSNISRRGELIATRLAKNNNKVQDYFVKKKYNELSNNIRRILTVSLALLIIFLSNIKLFNVQLNKFQNYTSLRFLSFVKIFTVGYPGIFSSSGLELGWENIALIFFFFLFYISWFYYLKLIKSQNLDYEYLKKSSRTSLSSKVKKISTKIKERFTKYNNTYLTILAFLALNCHCFFNVALKKVYEQCYLPVKGVNSLETIGSVFAPKRLFDFYFFNCNVAILVAAWMLIFWLFRTLQDKFVTDKEVSALLDVYVYLFLLWVQYGYFYIKLGNLGLEKYLLFKFLDLSVIRALSVATALGYRQIYIRGYFRSILKEESAEAISQSGLIFSILATVIKGFFSPFVYLTGAVVLNTIVTLAMLEETYKNRLEKRWRNDLLN